MIGGTSLFGGIGHIKSALLGALVIASIDNGLGLLGLGSGEKFLITGGVLLLAVTVDSLSRRRQAQSGTSVTDRVAFITGASRGVGAAVARAFHCGGHARGAGVAQRRRPRASRGRSAWSATCATPTRCRRPWTRRWSEFGGLDVAVANAGVGAYGPFLEMDPDDVEAMIDVNLKGTLYTARFALPHLIESKGDFVSLASVAGLRAFPGEAIYNASKFGQLGFTRALDHELREQGVRVTNIAPGGIATDFAMGSGREPGSTEGMMSAEEVADVVLFAVNQPRNLRMMTVAFRPMNEESWG